MAPVLVTLNDVEGHLPSAGLFKCKPSNICAAFYQISIDSALALAAELLVIIWTNWIHQTVEDNANSDSKQFFTR